MSSLPKPVLLKVYFLMSALESAVVFYLLISIPPDLKNIVFLGYSLRRLFVLAAVLALFFLTAAVFVRMSISADFSNKIIRSVLGIFDSPFRVFFVSAVSTALLILGLALFLTPIESLTGVLSYLQRLAPAIYLGALIGLQTLIGQYLWRGQRLNWSLFFEWKRLLVISGLLIGLLLAFFVWASWTGLGLVPEEYGWLPPGTPIIFPQLFLVWLLVLPFILWGDKIQAWWDNFQQRLPFHIRLDMIICVALWLAAFVTWWSQPMTRESYFISHPAAPNFESYPFSDAAIYDLSAQNIIIGADQNNKTVLRPLYVFFLAFAHMLAGQEYTHVIFYQVLFLAVIPVLAYRLASMLAGRVPALLMAVLIILREKNGIALTNVIEVSHSKLMMSDMPAMALMLLLVYLFIKCLRGSSNGGYYAIIAGSAFGMLMLVRSHQAVFITPALVLGMAFAGGFQLRRSIRRIMLFIIGFALVTAPWIWRNYEVNGKPEIESTEFYIGSFAGAYTEPGDTVDVLPGESNQAYSARIKQQVFQYILKHPLELARVYATYFVRNEIDSVVYMPVSFHLYDLRSYVSRMGFWSEPLLHFTFGAALIFFATLGVVILGTCIAVQRSGLLGWMPLLFHFTYNFSMSLARISGWRYVLPVDWVTLFYYSIGLAALTMMAISLISNQVRDFASSLKDAHGAAGLPAAGLKGSRLVVLFLLVFGISMPVTEMIVPERYAEGSAQQRSAGYMAAGISLDNGSTINPIDLKSFLETEPDAVSLYGRALYPLFYRQGKYSGDDNQFSLLERKFNRLQFTYIGSENAPVFIQMDLSPRTFPNASDVLIIGCRQSSGIRALAVRLNDQPAFISSSPWQGLTCEAP